MSDDLEERLRSHARSFDSLLSLIPAKLYYGEDVSDQWKRKKQTPEQKREARIAKLDPANWKSAKDVADERAAAARKRKREEDGNASDEGPIDTEEVQSEQADNPKAKKRKQESVTEPSPASRNTQTKEETDEERIERLRQKKAAKRQRKRNEKAKAKEQLKQRKSRKRAEKEQKEPSQTKPESKSSSGRKQEASKSDEKDEDDDEENEDEAEPMSVDHDNALTLKTSAGEDLSESSASDAEQQEIFSPFHESGTSSISSIQTPATEDRLKPPSQPELVDQTTANGQSSGDAKARLQAAIASFRSERKADFNPKSRGELLAHRRQLEEKRRAEKKEQKRKETEAAERKREEEIAARFSPGGSGSLLASPRSPLVDSDTNNFSFGRVAFEDGTDFNHDNVTQGPKRKGPQDPTTALKSALSKQQRISGLDEDKKANIQEKDMWLNARKRAAGEKVKDDTSLLKKALKRHEGQKKKSEKEWNDRKEGVQKSMDMKQKKRNENIAKRKEEKGVKHSKGKPSKVKRPGFEGSFRGRSGGGKKKS